MTETCGIFDKQLRDDGRAMKCWECENAYHLGERCGCSETAFKGQKGHRSWPCTACRTTKSETSEKWTFWTPTRVPGYLPLGMCRSSVGVLDVNLGRLRTGSIRKAPNSRTAFPLHAPRPVQVKVGRAGRLK
nr:uncharacterized protein LOC129386127 [Dermacentor andersoni]